MQEAKNPVGKLLGYMEKAVEAPGNIFTSQAWAQVFSCKPDDSRSVVRGLAMLMDLSVTSRRAIEQYVPGDKALFLAPFPRIDKLLSNHSFTDQWQTHKPMLDAVSMSALKFGDYALTQAYPAANPEKSAEIAAFLQRLEDLVNECLKSELSHDVQKLFIRHLEAIRKALLDYHLGGTADLESVVDQAIGSMHRHAEVIGGESEKGLAIARRVFEAIAGVNELVTFSQSVLLISAPLAVNLLPLLR